MTGSLTAEQRRVLQTIVQRGQRAGASPKEVKAAVETGLVESNLRNLPGGDADSQGWRQERRSLYPNPTNVAASADRFFKETRAVRGKYGSAGDLAAAVQRPAAQYRGRYHEQSGRADAILAALGGRAVSGSSGSPGTVRTVATPGVDNSSARRQALANWVLSDSTDPIDAVSAMSAVPSDVAPTSRTVNTSGVTGASRSAPAATSAGASAAVSFGRARIGQYRESTGSNRGPQLDSLQKRFGMSAQPWCAMFTSVAATRGGMPAVGRTASVEEVRRQVQSGGGGYKQGFQRPKAGDMMLFGNRHIAMVDSVNRDGSVNLLNGNGSDGKVSLRKNVAAGTGEFARPKYSAR